MKFKDMSFSQFQFILESYFDNLRYDEDKPLLKTRSDFILYQFLVTYLQRDTENIRFQKNIDFDAEKWGEFFESERNRFLANLYRECARRHQLYIQISDWFD